MPNESNQRQDNKSTAGKSSGAAASGAGMQVSGEEIFLPEDNQPKVTKESDVFGQQKDSAQSADDAAKQASNKLVRF